MYMFISDLAILFRVGIVEINNMMQPYDGGRMEEEAWTWGVRMCVVA